MINMPEAFEIRIEMYQYRNDRIDLKVSVDRIFGPKDGTQGCLYIEISFCCTLRY
jgi:hypothetical protein